MSVNNLLAKSTLPIALYNSEQVYAMEQAWFAMGHDSFAIMQQAAWQMAHHIQHIYDGKCQQTSKTVNRIRQNSHHKPRASIWVGRGNNGGDGWLIAYYLQQAGWQVQVITVGFASEELNDGSVDQNTQGSMTDADKARKRALSADCPYQRFEEIMSRPKNYPDTHFADQVIMPAAVYVDALFGIGLDRMVEGVYKDAIDAFNYETQHHNGLSVAVDIPSGLVASTGQVFSRVAVQADITLCLVARKFGLHTKDGMDYSGDVLDIPLIPYSLNPQESLPVAKLLSTAHRMTSRWQNSHKGSYGNVLVIGGNRIDGSQGMGGAAILSAASAMATGAGKITVACHEAFHAALLTSLPDAMTLNLHDIDGVERLIDDASVIAIGMGLGRDEKAHDIFVRYLKAAIVKQKPIVIDADALYHLASLQAEGHNLVAALRAHSLEERVCLTPHSGEAARLLDKEINEVENDRLAAIKQCAQLYGGDWVLKGAGSLVLEQRAEHEEVYICGTGNAGMASAGMGDVLSGVIAGLLAQDDLQEEARSLHQAALIHGMAGDILVYPKNDYGKKDRSLMIGQRGLQAQDMTEAIRHVLQTLIIS